MLIVYTLLGLLGLVVLLVLAVLFVPAYGHITYDGELRVYIRVLGVPITLLPSEQAASKQTTHSSKRQKTAKPSKIQELREELSRSFKQDGVTATITYLTELAQLVGQAVGRAFRSVTVDDLQLHMLISDGDADTTAIRYGQVCSALYPTFTALAGVMKVRKRSLRIEPNFLQEKSRVSADVRLHIWVYRLMGTAIVLLVRFMLLKGYEDTDSITDKEETNHGK